MRIRSSRDFALGFTLIELLVVIAIIAILAAILFPVFAKAKERAHVTTCISNEKQIGLGMMQYVDDNNDKFPLFAWNRIPSPTPVMSRDCPSDGYDAVIRPYLKSWEVYACPSQRYFPTWSTDKMVSNRPSPDSPTKGRSSYGYNWTLVNLSLVMSNAPRDGRLTRHLIKDPAGTIFLAENENGGHITYEPVSFQGKSTGAPDSPAYQNLANDPEVMRRLRVPERHFGSNNYIFADGHVKTMVYSSTKVPHNMWSLRADD